MSWSIANPDANDRATIVAVWTAMVYGVELDVAKSKLAPENKTTLLVSSSLGTSIAGGGNAMAQAIASSSPTEATSFMNSCMIDEWCEWERTTLRKKCDVSHLDGRGLHLVGDSLTIADICVATTLLLLHSSDDKTLPKSVQLYLNHHRSAFEAAKLKAQSLQQSLQQQQGQTSVSTDLMNEPSFLTVVDTVFRTTITQVFGNVDLPKVIVKSCQNTKHGDFQCSAAMPIYAIRRDSYKSPQEVAMALVKSLSCSSHPILSDLTVQGAGFVICRLSTSFLQAHLRNFLQLMKLPIPKAPKQQTSVVDFSSPNIAKEMHVGHLRSTIIGESVCRILETAGHTVHRVNHVGDWGTQFGMLIEHMKETYTPDPNDTTAPPNITDLTAFYKQAKIRFDNDPDFKKRSQLNVVKLQSGDPECRKIWQMLCDVSRIEFQQVYERLDVVTEEFGESFYNDKIPPVIDELDQKGMILVQEGGAKCVFVDKFKVPLMLQKSDGGYGYDSTDMAALKYRLQELKADRVIVITDFSQAGHFAMVYAAGHDAGWVTGSQKLQHIGFGTVQGEDGKRIKSRSGDTVRLVDLLDEAVQRMETELLTRLDEGKANIERDEIYTVAEAIGYGAVKYYDLRRNPTSNYKFSYDQMLDTKGDTAVYLLYTRVRLESIIDKAAQEYNVNIDDLLKSNFELQISHPSERNLALQLLLFADYMALALDDLYPCHICEYLYKLAVSASDFVTQCRVLGSDEMPHRVLLCHCVVNAMHQSFDLLGIRHVKRI